MKLDPVLLEYFRQMNDTLTEVVAIYQMEMQIISKLAEKNADKEGDTSDPSSSD